MGKLPEPNNERCQWQPAGEYRCRSLLFGGKRFKIAAPVADDFDFGTIPTRGEFEDYVEANSGAVFDFDTGAKEIRIDYVYDLRWWLDNSRDEWLANRDAAGLSSI